MTRVRHWLPTKLSIGPLLFVLLMAHDVAFGLPR